MAEAQSPPINWNEFLGSTHAEVPLACLRPTFKYRMAMHLNKEIVVLTDEFCPDWRGLAELIGFDGIEIYDIGRHENPGREVIERWIRMTYLEPTVGNLVRHLSRLARMDILTDLGNNLLEEVRFHENRHAHFEKENPIQDNTVSSAEGSRRILTIDDTLTTIAIYDAFVSYEYSDLPFVKEMIRRLESKGFKLFVPGRNNLIGTNSFELMSRIISERCRHMIVVLSNNFIQSEICNFQSAYAFSLSPGARDKKMVPIKIEECVIPEPLRIMALCDFTHQDVLDWSWERLEGSIRRPMPNPEFNGPESWNSLSPQSSSSSSSMRLPPLPPSQSSRSCVSERPVPESESRHPEGESGYISGISAARQASASSSRQDLSVDGKPSGSQDPPSNVKNNVTRALKRITNFASPKSKRKENQDTKF